MTRTLILLAALAGSGTVTSGCTKVRVKGVVVDDALAPRSRTVPGVVRVRNGTEKPLRRGMGVRLGDELTTHEGATVYMRKGRKVRLVLYDGTIRLGSIDSMGSRFLVWIQEQHGRFEGFWLNRFERVGDKEGRIRRHGTELLWQDDPDGDLLVVVLHGSATLESRFDAWPPVPLGPGQGVLVPQQATVQPPAEDWPPETLREIVTEANKVEHTVRGDKARLIMPKLLGLGEGDALDILRASTIRSQLDEELTKDPALFGTVARQSVTAGERVRAKSSVTLWIWREGVELSSLLGTERATAEETVRRAGLSPRVEVGTACTGAPAGTVTGQPSEAGRGELIRKGATVTLTVEPECITVADLVGSSEEAALSRLDKAGLVPRISDQTCTGAFARGTVNGQDPAPGRDLPRGSTVRLTVEADCVEVPVMTQRTPEDASGLAEKYEVSLAFDEELVEGAEQALVIDQDPGPGTWVERGSRVDLVVGLPAVRAPALRDTPASRAESALSSAGLVLGSVSMSREVGSPGDIADQSPAAGLLVERGSSVRIWVYSETEATSSPASGGPEGTTVPESVIGLDSYEACRILEGVGLGCRYAVEDAYRYKLCDDGDYTTIVRRTEPPVGEVVDPGTEVTVYGCSSRLE